MRISLGLKPLKMDSGPKPAPAPAAPQEPAKPSEQDIRAKLAEKRSRRRWALLGVPVGVVGGDM